MKKIKLGLLTGIVMSLVIGILGWQMGSLYMEYAGTHAAIQNLDERIASLSRESLRNQRNLAKWYNFSLKASVPEETLREAYGGILDFGAGRMGYLVFPAASVTLEFFHEAEGSGNAVGLVHRAGSALPVGGSGNHTVLEGELPMEKIRTGDLFYIYVLDDVLVYAVDEIGGDLLQSADGEDRCTILVPEGDEAVSVSGIRLDPELEQRAMEEKNRVLPIDRRTLALAVAAALGAGLLPVLTALVHRQKSHGNCSM